MNGDDIVFDDVRYREPARLRRPDRDRRFACVACEIPGPLDLPIFLDHRTADAVERHALSDTTVELGGVLVGKECVDSETGEPFVWITRSLEAKHYENTQASFTYTHDSWEEITRERDRRFPDLDVVGWYHTHPSFGIFLSYHDLFIHQHFFSQRLQVAYVVDPINQTRGFFQWRDGSMVPLGGFFLVGDRGDRQALARQVNDLENLSHSEETGGGAFSPRLEAELIRMLNRPTTAYASSTPAERAQAAVIFTMLGGMLGVLALAVAFWLYQISVKFQEQGEALGGLSRVVKESADTQRAAFDLVLDQAKGDKSPELIERFTASVKERGELATRLGTQTTISQTLAARSKELEAELAESRSALESAKRELAVYAKAVQDAPKLREQLAKLEATAQEQKMLLDKQADVVESVEGKHAEQLLQHLTQVRYLAYLGWGLSAALALAAVAVWFLRGSPGRVEADSPLPHQIT